MSAKNDIKKNSAIPFRTTSLVNLAASLITICAFALTISGYLLGSFDNLPPEWRIFLLVNIAILFTAIAASFFIIYRYVKLSEDVQIYKLDHEENMQKTKDDYSQEISKLEVYRDMINVQSKNYHLCAHNLRDSLAITNQWLDLGEKDKTELQFDKIDHMIRQSVQSTLNFSCDFVSEFIGSKCAIGLKVITELVEDPLLPVRVQIFARDDQSSQERAIVDEAVAHGRKYREVNSSIQQIMKNIHSKSEEWVINNSIQATFPGYQSTNEHYEKYYNNNIIVPVQCNFARAYQEKRWDGIPFDYDVEILGFLQADSMNAEFDRLHVDILAAIADQLYLLLARYIVLAKQYNHEVNITAFRRKYS